MKTVAHAKPAGASLHASEHHRRQRLEPGQTTLAIEGEEYANAYLERLQAGIASPGELAVIVAFLNGAMLHGACRVIEKALGVEHA